MVYKQGDLYKVTALGAPHYGKEGPVREYDPQDLYPVVLSITIDGEEYSVCYRESEVEKVDADATTQEIPVVTA